MSLKNYWGMICHFRRLFPWSLGDRIS